MDEREEDFLFAPSQPSLSLCRAVGTGGGWRDYVGSCSIMFFHVQLCFFMLMIAYVAHLCSIKSVSCYFMVIHVRS